MHASDQEIYEQHILDRVRANDEKAFVLLLNAQMPMIRQETARFRNVAVDEDDLAQEAALGLLAAAKAFRKNGGASFATFARICVRRRLINTVRTLPMEEIPHESPFDVCERDADLTMSPDRLIQEKEEETALLSKLKSELSEREYRVLILHISSYSYSDIARILRISPKSVDNALQRIRRKLKSKL